MYSELKFRRGIWLGKIYLANVQPGCRKFFKLFFFSNKFISYLSNQLGETLKKKSKSIL